VRNDPLNNTDPTGRIVDTIVDIGFIIYDVGALAYDEVTTGGANRTENLLALGADAAGAIVPFATGGGLAVRAATHADDVGRGARALSDSDLVVRGGGAARNGGNSVEGITRGTSTHPSGATGFSAEASPGASLCDLCANVPNNQVGVTTVGEIRAVGGDVVVTSGRSPNHATVTGISPEEANRQLTPTQPNPVPPDERRFR
jgi:hypothetical protein